MKLHGLRAELLNRGELRTSGKAPAVVQRRRRTTLRLREYAHLRQPNYSRREALVGRRAVAAYHEGLRRG